MIRYSNAIRDDQDRALCELAKRSAFPAWLEWTIGLLAILIIVAAWLNGLARDPFHSQPASDGHDMVGFFGYALDRIAELEEENA